MRLCGGRIRLTYSGQPCFWSGLGMFDADVPGSGLRRGLPRTRPGKSRSILMCAGDRASV